jgi:tyrosine-protein phosphatase SIW14
MSPMSRRVFGGLIAALVFGVPVVYHRYVYTKSKRLREVTPGVLYRSGQLTAPGFLDAVERFGIRTIVNLQEEAPDPDVYQGYFTSETVKESEICRRLGLRYVHIPPDVLRPSEVAERRPAAIDRFLAVMDDPSAYPVLLHCRAGLHRTGVLSAVYRMEYQGWTPAQAIRELKDHGFGEYACTSANDYIMQYILTYRPGVRIQVVRGP